VNAECLAEWVKTAIVDKYESEHKLVLVATKNNEQLILTCNRVLYPHGRHPHINLVWIKDGISELLHQTIVDEIFGQIRYTTGNLSGENCSGENLETVFSSLIMKAKECATS